MTIWALRASTGEELDGENHTEDDMSQKLYLLRNYNINNIDWQGSTSSKKVFLENFKLPYTIPG